MQTADADRLAASPTGTSTRRRSSTRAPARPSSTLPEASPDQVDEAVAAAARPSPRWSRTTPAERAGAAPQARRPDRGGGRGLRRARGAELRQAAHAVMRDEMPAIVDCLRFFAGAARVMPARGGGRIPAGLHLDDPPRPDRRGRLDRAVELPADDGGVEDRAGARRRQHDGAEAVRADAADHAEAGEDRRRDPAGGRAQRRRRPRRDASATR